MADHDQQYQTGFNNGYLLAKFLPDLLVKIVNNLHVTNSYVAGLVNGQKEYEQEYSPTWRKYAAKLCVGAYLCPIYKG